MFTSSYVEGFSFFVFSSIIPLLNVSPDPDEGSQTAFSYSRSTRVATPYGFPPDDAPIITTRSSPQAQWSGSHLFQSQIPPGDGAPGLPPPDPDDTAHRSVASSR